MNYELEQVPTHEENESQMYHLFLKKNHYMKRHYHPFLEIVYIIKGAFHAYIDGKSLFMQTEQLLIIQPYSIHYFEMIEDSEMITILVPYSLLKKYDTSLEKKEFFIPQDNTLHIEIKTLIKNIDVIRKNKELYQELQLQKNYFELYYLLLNDMTRLTNKPILQYSKQIQPIIDYIEKHYHEHISYQDLSHQCGYSYTYFCRYFKKMTGMSLLQFQKSIQLKHAYLDVCYSDKQVNQIAYIHGFSNTKLFIQAFKNEYELTPQQYRFEKCQKTTIR